jgi:hypothetical protein
MESWPLQLEVETSSGHIDVLLSDNTIVIQKGQSVPTSVLVPGMRVSFSSKSDLEHTTSILAKEIIVGSS